MRRFLQCAAGLGFGLLAATAGRAQPQSDAGVVRFVYPDTLAKSVSLAGDFNGWSPTATPLDREGAAWVTRVFLDAGAYEYKFFVDGGWQPDPRNPELSPQGNSLVRVGKDGAVEPPRAAPAAASGGSAASAVPEALAWSLRYLGFATLRRDPALGRYDLDTPLHDIDLRVDGRITPDVTSWFLAHFETPGPSNADNTTLRFERGAVQWTPSPWTLRLFDHTSAASFDDPGALVGRVGRYADEFGYGRSGIDLRRRVLGAPLELVYTDNAERSVNQAPPTSLPDLDGPSGAGLEGQTVQRYVTSGSDRGADALGFRGRFGTEKLGLGVSLRVDRGANAGRLSEVDVVRTPGDTLVGTGRELETTETWSGLGLDVRTRWRGARLAAEFLSGVNRARARRSAPILILRAPPGAAFTERLLGDAVASEAEFDLDHSRRVIARVGNTNGQPAAGSEIWSARPGTGQRTGAHLRYEYEEHDFSALTTGAPFLMRRHALAGGVDLARWGVTARLDVEQDWFQVPDAGGSPAQFWLREGNFWLDQDIVGVDQLTLLGAPQAAVARLHAAGLLWPKHEWRGEAHVTWAAPGFDVAPRAVENVFHISVPLHGPLALRTHSRVVVYREFEPIDAAAIARFGTGVRIETGAPDFAGVQVEHSYHTFASHFVELVYAVNARSDVALGFGVDPFIVYEVTNEYEPVGWDEFVFGQGVDPGADPSALGTSLHAAEGALESERRLVLEARLRF